MIPRKLHYVWLGGKEKSKLTEICINSWKRFMPDFEIVEWNEASIDMEFLCQRSRFLSCCYNLKLWAFVSDYVRLWVLYNEGGIYLDTDVEVIKSYSPLLDNHVFMGYENGDYIGTAVIGSEASSPLIKRLLDFYDHEIWNVDFINNPIIFKYLQEKEPKWFEGCVLYSENYFSPYVPGRKYISTVDTTETYSIHWYTQNWNMSRKGYVFIHTKHIHNPVLKILSVIKKNIGYYRKKCVNIHKKTKSEIKHAKIVSKKYNF